MPIFIDDEINALPDSRHMTVLGRALTAYGVSWELGDRRQVVITDEDFDLADLECDEFYALMEEEYKRMVATDLIDGLVSKGLITADAINGEGELQYTMTPEGEAAHAAASV